MTWAGIIAGVLAWLKSVFPSLVGAFAAHEYDQGRATSRELAAMDAAIKAGSSVDNLSDDDVVRQLKERGMLGVPDVPADGERQR